MSDTTPELVMLSDNECPNSGPDSIFGTDCTSGALTIWGYCGTCWTHAESRIPKAWIDRVDEQIMAAEEAKRS